jgi:hypothetical protein
VRAHGATDQSTERAIGGDACQAGSACRGRGLYLVVDKGGAKRWVLLFRWRGKLKEMGLGGFTSVPLARARELAAECRAALAAGQDPIVQSKVTRIQRSTFGDFADAFLATKLPGWKNANHRTQWTTALTDQAGALQQIPIDKIDTNDVLSVLKPIWLTTSETASRLRGRIETVLDAARASGHRTGDNPARWRGHLDHLLPKKPRSTQRDWLSIQHPS